MATYAIGDVQGCLPPLQRLLQHVGFEPARDRLLFTGDLVNRGPDSLATLRFVRALGAAATVVLGNHDLHLLALAAGGRGGPRDTLQDILAAPDREELLDWLRHRPLAWLDAPSGTLVVHAGLPPQWSAADALARAAEVEAALRERRAGLFERMYGDHPDRWDDALQGIERLRFIINALTRMRYCTTDGRIDVRHKGGPGHHAPNLLPWFAAPGRRSEGTRIVFGHWSTLGAVDHDEGRVQCLDSGCVWGNCLTAVQLETGRRYHADCSEYRKRPAA